MMVALREFFAMGGYGFYVWTSYALGAIVLTLNAVLALRRERQLTRELGRRTPRQRGDS